MKTKKPNAELIYKQFEDDLAPRLRLCVTDRAVYYHLLRHSRLEGKSRLHFSKSWLARNLTLSEETIRISLRRLVANGAIRLVYRSRAGHVVDVRLPGDVPMSCPRTDSTLAAPSSTNSANLENLDFVSSPALRRAIHAREGGICFYCLRRMAPEMKCLDHVVPRSRHGSSSYRNLVSCCLDCNGRKGERSAPDFLRLLYREGRLTGAELQRTLHSLKHLAAGKLRPPI